MPIDAALLEQIKNNDPTLRTLDLNNKDLNDDDIQQLVNALANNTFLTALNVGNNNISDEGAKMLAMSTTLTNLDVSISTNFFHDTFIEDEGAKALAANTTIATLNLKGHWIGDEGAKALTTNATLTNLDVSHNRIDIDLEEQIKQTIARNNQQVVKRRDQFIQKLILLAVDKGTKESRSLRSVLPKEVMLYLISGMNFRSVNSIGKSSQQIGACADFIFDHVPQLKESLTEAINTKQDFKIMEKITDGNSQFRFFPLAKSSIKLPENLSPEENTKKTDENHFKK
jgi:hypothetical protein